MLHLFYCLWLRLLGYQLCYIAGKISDPDPVIEHFNKSRFYEAERQVRAEGMVPVNPCRLPHWLHSTKWESYMRLDIACMVLFCKHIALIHGFAVSPGATMEYEIALNLKFQTWHLCYVQGKLRLIRRPAKQRLRNPQLNDLKVYE